jgi:hypothetical protein
MLEPASRSDRTVVGLALGLTVPLWCLRDGRVRGKIPLRAGLLGILVIPQLGLPIYLVWSRGFVGILTFLVFIIPLFASSIAASLLVWTLTG